MKAYPGLVLVLVLTACISLQAQTTGTGTVAGTVTDATGAVVPGVQITATQTATGASRSTTTDAQGYYVFTFLPIGEYEIKASKAGFATIDRKSVILNADITVALNLTLKVGAANETVTVTGTPPALNTETGGVSTLVSGAQVQELALNG